MEYTSYSVTTILAHHRVIICLGVSLNNMTNIAQTNARFDDLNSFIQTLLCHFDQSSGMGCDVTQQKHLAGITVKSVFDHGDIYVEDIATFQNLAVTGNAMTYHVI